MYEAIRDNDLQALRKAIEAGADVNARDIYGETLFFKACEDGRTDIARLLLEKGAHVNIGNRFGHTPLHCISKDWLQDPGPQVLFAADPAREENIDLFREHVPEVVMEKFCTQGPGEGR